jgi:transcriptional regulator with XRE-family HTH domain
VTKGQHEFPLDDKIGARLRANRKELGLNQTQMAEIGGVGLSTQHRYEAGGLPSLEYLLRIGKAGADWVWIITGRKLLTDSLDEASMEVLETFNGLTTFLKGVALAQLQVLATASIDMAEGQTATANISARPESVHSTEQPYRSG